MKERNVSFGANEDSKKYKKTIKINVTWKHMTGFFLVLCLWVFLIIQVLMYFGVFTVEQQQLECTDGTIETVEYGKEYYCDKHYTVLKEHTNKHLYKALEDTILRNGTKE